jgi:branched-chain amino acid transport system permease protein
VKEFLLYTISGLTTGGIYAITASGLTLTYSTTGVFNFAHGAVGMVAAFAYWQLRFGWGVPTLVSVAVVILLLAPLFGLGLERAVMRRLAGASEVSKLVVTVAVMLGLMSFALWVWDPSVARSVRPLWSGRVFEWGLVRVSYNDLIVIAVAASVAVGLRLLLYRTRSGVAMRAQVDNRDLAVMMGARPVHSARLAWIIGTSLAALAGILVAPKLSLSPLPLTLLIVDAYAASVIGRLRSLPMTFVGALILGLLNDYGVGYLPKIHVGQQYLRGFVGVTPVAVLFVSLLVLDSRRIRWDRVTHRRELTPRPTWRGSLAFAAAVVIGTVILSTILSPGDLFNITRVWGLALVGLSMVPLIGYAGRISLCQLSFGGIGAIIAAHLGSDGNLLALVAAVVAAAAVGALVALPALRLTGIYLALSTAAFAVALDRWIFGLPGFSVFGHSITIFQTGSLALTRPRLGPLDLSSDRAFFIASAVAFAACSLVVVAVRRSRLGLRLEALRDSPTACVSIGINTDGLILIVFTFSAALAGLGGALYGMGLQSVSSDRFELLLGVSVLLAMVVGGVRSIGAAVFAGLFLGGPTLANLFPHLTQLTSMTIALAAIAVGSNPNGLVADVIRPRWMVVLQRPLMLLGGILVIGLVWVLRLVDVIDNWGWALATLGVFGALPILSGSRAVEREEVGAVEMWGLTMPYRSEDVALLDRVLAMPVAVHTDGRPTRKGVS